MRLVLIDRDTGEETDITEWWLQPVRWEFKPHGLPSPDVDLTAPTAREIMQELASYWEQAA